MMAHRIFTVFFLTATLYAQSPQRIVSTAPSITELLYALGLGNRIVGVDRFSRYPPEASSKPRIGDYAAPNLEVIASLRPDLVLIPTNPVQLRERLEAMRLRVLELNQEGIPALYESFRIVGRATGMEREAERLTQQTQAALEAIRARAAKLPRTRVLFVAGRTPGRLEGLIVAGRASYLNEIIEIAGGENIFAGAQAAYPMVALEEILARNPEVIIDMGEMGDTVGVTEAQKKSVESLWTRMSSVAAVRNRRVHAVASDVFVVPGPRVVDAAREFLALLHPPATGDVK
jgi:iron complex transport system substrate-binding protein